jgi:hypothetical protein
MPNWCPFLLVERCESGYGVTADHIPLGLWSEIPDCLSVPCKPPLQRVIKMCISMAQHNDKPLSQVVDTRVSIFMLKTRNFGIRDFPLCLHRSKSFGWPPSAPSNCLTWFWLTWMIIIPSHYRGAWPHGPIWDELRDGKCSNGVVQWISASI